MSWIARFFRKKILLKYENSSIEELFVSSFVEQINDFQVYFSSLSLFLYCIVNTILYSIDEEKENRTIKIILFSIELVISILVMLVGRHFVCARFIVLYIQQIFFVAVQTIFILEANDKSERFYLILVSFCLHILIMPQSQHIYILLSNLIYFTLLMFSYTEFNWKEMWQIWILLGIVGLELRLFVDEKQKRILFHDESFVPAQQQEENGVQMILADQGSPTSSTRHINLKQLGANVPQAQNQQLQNNRQAIGHQQSQQINGNNIYLNQGSIHQDTNEINKQTPQISYSPTSNQQKQQQDQNSKGEGVFSSQNILNNQNAVQQSNFVNNNFLSVQTNKNQQNIRFKNDTLTHSPLREQSHTVSNLKRKMSIFQMRKGMEDLRKVIQSSSIMMNNEAGQIKINNGHHESNNGLNNSIRQDIPYSLQISPLLPKVYESPLSINTLQQRKPKQNNLYNLMPFSFLYGRFDPQNIESITLILVNNKAKNLYQITDSSKFNEFLKKCKINSALLKTSFDSANNSLKKIITMKYQEIIEEKKNSRSQVSSNPNILSIDFKRNGNSHLTVNENQQGNYNRNQHKNFTSIDQKPYQQLPNKNLLNQNFEMKDNNYINNKESENIEILIDLNGQKLIAKVIILYNDEFFIIINDDSYEKFLLDQQKRAAYNQLNNYIDMMSYRFQSISNLIIGSCTKKEVLFETFLATNYFLNMKYSIKEILSCKIDIQQKKFKISDMLQKVKDMVERESKKSVQIIIDEGIPNECRRIYNDFSHLLRILTNIIENSYNNTEQGFVQILIHQSRIFEDNVRFDIIDSGKGIDPQVVKLINDNNFFNDEEEEDVINRLFLLFSSTQNKNSKTKIDKNNEDDEDKRIISEDTVIKGFGLKFSHHMIKILGPYNRIYAESIPGVGSRISFIVYKEGVPSQEGYFKPYQFKNDNFEQEMAYFNPMNSNPQNQQNCTLKEYIEHVLTSIDPPPFVENSLLNINKPTKTRTFYTPFTLSGQFDENNVRDYRSISANQIKGPRHKVSFSKIKSSKNIADQQKNLVHNNSLSPLIAGIHFSNNNSKYINSIALSQSPTIYTQKSLNPSLNQEGQIENISNIFRNFQPAQSQMYNEMEKGNNLNNTQGSLKNPVQDYNSPKDKTLFPSQNIQTTGVVLNFPNIRRNNSNPSSNNNFIIVPDSNFSSASNLNNNINGNQISHQNLNNAVMPNLSIYQPNHKYIQSSNNQNIYNTINQKTFSQSKNQLNVPNYSDRVIIDYNSEPNQTQLIINDQYNGKTEQVGYFIKQLQNTN